MWRTRFSVAALACVVLMLAVSANAGWIYLDEDFDQGTVFADQGWLINNSVTSASTLAAIDASQGVKVCRMDGSTSNPAAAPIFTNTGATTSARYFTAPNSLQLSGTQKFSFTMDPASTGSATSSYPNRTNDKTIQFVVAVSTPTLAGIANGTRIGHFKIDYSTDSTTDQTVEKTFQLDFVKSSDSEAKIQYAGSDVATIRSTSGMWTVVTVLVQIDAAGTAAGKTPTSNWWGAADYFRGNPLWKGPQDLGPGPGAPSTTSLIYSGFTVFCNSNSPTLYVSPAAFDPTNNWGNGTAPSNRTAEVGWEIAAENGGTIFVDDMFYSYPLIDQNNTGTLYTSYREMANRIVTFTGTLECEEPLGAVPASARNWALY